MNITTLPEATFNECIWSLLKEIRTQHLFTGGVTPIVLMIEHRQLGDAMKEKLDLIGQMQKLQIVRVAGDGTFDENAVTAFIQLEICNPLFDHVYTLYERGNLRGTEARKLLEMFNEVVKNPYEDLSSETKTFLEERDRIPSQLNNSYMEIVIGELVACSDGTIKYGGKDMRLRAQLKDLCRLFMSRHGKLVTYDDIKDEIISSKKRDIITESTIQKYVSALHASLMVFTKKPVIFNHEKEGWHFNISGLH